MGFEECYLVPKELYEKHQHTSSLVPPDVRLKQWDYKKRFQSSVHTAAPSDDAKLDRQIQTILNGIPDVLRRNLGSQILTFIVSKGGGTIKWTDDFQVFLDNRRLYNLDIREVLRHLVGVNHDIKRESYPIYERLLSLGINPTLLMFYDDPAETDNERDWDEPGELSKSDEEDWDADPGQVVKHDTKHLGESKHPMKLRHNLPKWTSYRF